MEKGRFIPLCVIISLLLIASISAEKLQIDIQNPEENISPGDNLIFTITLYDDNLKPIQGTIDYEIQNFLKEPLYKGTANSNQEIVIELPTDTEKGFGAVIATYKEIETRELFNVIELKKINIELENDYLIITNIGNTEVFSEQISISIGEHHETALISLAIGQIKKIRLTAPPGEYDIRVSDETGENTLKVQGVSLTGNVIGLEKLKEKSFWEEYPLVILFLFIIIVIALIVTGLKVRDKHLN